MSFKNLILGLSNTLIIVVCVVIQPLYDEYRSLVSDFRFFIAPASIALFTVATYGKLKKLKNGNGDIPLSLSRLLKLNFIIGASYFIIILILFIVAETWKI